MEITEQYKKMVATAREQAEEDVKKYAEGNTVKGGKTQFLYDAYQRHLLNMIAIVAESELDL